MSSGPRTRFVVLAAPRTGSNWLCSLLDSHPEVLCHHEIFNPEGIHYALSCRGGELDLGTVEARDRDPEGVLRRVWTETLGYPAVGFKLNRGQSPEALRAVLEDEGVKKVVVERGNRVKTYVSERIAEATGEWESYPESPSRRREVRIVVDPADLSAHASGNRRYYDRIERGLWETGQTALRVVYERLPFEVERRRILEHLEVDPGAPLHAATRKQNPRDLRNLIANFDELAAALGESDLAAELHDRDL